MKVTALVVVSALMACTSRARLGDRTSDSGAACDPTHPDAIAVGTIVGVGRDATGALYVDASNGIFVSEGGRLVRQHVLGSGQSGANELIFTFAPPGGDASARNLLVETTGARASAMALGPASARTFLDQTDGGVTSLELVGADAVAGFPVVNTPNVISYVGDVANGDVVVATVPLNVDSASQPGVIGGGLTIFYGPPSAVAERRLTAFQQTLSGNGTLTFLVGDLPYALAFGNVPGPDAGPLGMFDLQGLTPEGGATMAVTLRTPTPTTLPADLSFICWP